jgi:hypothetical protein
LAAEKFKPSGRQLKILDREKMQVYLQTLDYRRLASISIVVLILAMVQVMDGMSAWNRKRYLLSAHAS